MRNICGIFFVFLLTISGILAGGVPDAKKIEELKKGIRTQADASWWGFHKEDATKCLQAAIDSGAKKLILPNMGSPWILSKTIRLKSNQEIILASGTHILAKKGAFQPVWLGLFCGSGIKNTEIRGEGNNILKMHIKDYNDQKKYKLSEYRHGIYLSGSSNIRIRNLTIRDTGGDGISIGNGKNPCKDLLIENVTLDNNNRLGLSIVSGENITIRKCRFLNARSMAPSGGIDMEPNHPYERISNILIEDCSFINNKFNAIVVAVCSLNKDSVPVSVTIRNCKNVEKNSLGLWVQAMKEKGNGCKGTILMENCRLSNPVMFTNVVKENFSVTLKDTVLTLPPLSSYNEQTKPAISMVSNGDHSMEIGGLTFRNVKIVSPNSKRKPFDIFLYGRAKLDTPVKGTLFNNGKKVDLAPVIRKGKEKMALLNSLKDVVAPSLEKIVPGKNAASKEKFTIKGKMPLRRGTDFLIYGEKGKKCFFQTKITKFYKTMGNFSITDPAGKLLEKKTLSYENTNWLEHSFIPEKSGIYAVRCNPGINALEVRSKEPSAFLVKKEGITLAKPSGNFYFTVPAGTEEFSITFSASPGMNVKVLDPAGKCVWEKKKIRNAEVFTAKGIKSKSDRIWSMEIRQGVWEGTIKMHAPLIPLLSESPKLLLDVKR